MNPATPNPTPPQFAYLWEYIVPTQHQEQFRHIYGPQGQWVQLFSQSQGYLRTELHHDTHNSTRFLTIDYWLSREARDQFREQFAPQFAALDQACEALTVEERFIGDFEIID